MNLPNWITFSRLLGLPFIFYFFHDPTPNHRWIGVTIFLVVSLTDWLDGYLARKLDLITDLGKFLDPLVDKLLVLGSLLILIELNLIPAWGVFIILAREVAIAGWRVNPNLTGNSTIQGANMWGKVKTVSQMIAIAMLMSPLDPVWYFPSLIMFWLSVVLTVISGLIYVYPGSSDKKIKESQLS